jgi:myosin-5
MKLEVGTCCWIPDDHVGWLGVVVRKVDYDATLKKYRIDLESDDNNRKKFTVEIGDLTEHNKKLPQLRNLDDTVDDLTTLSHLNEPSVLNSVRLRYSKKKIYTFSGVVLIAINPFEKIDHLYTQDIIQKYKNADKSANPPHVFAIADDAYKLMKKSLNSQSIIVSGESGAGKTVSAKYIMRFFASVHTEGTSIDTTEIEKQILATNPIMESFGNAKTIRNDNSSRFGKYLKIFFDRNSIICGAKIQTYLLEHSRLVYQAQNERNYHIFYQLIQGLPQHLKDELFLSKCEDFHYLSKGGTFSINGVNDVDEFKVTCDALKIIGINEHQQFELFKILAALLHIGNINIENSRNEAILSDKDTHLLHAANLLGIDPIGFGKWITKKKISTRSDNIASTLKYHEAIVARDSISKFIYSSLFDWLVSYINADLCSCDIKEQISTFIGVLDIYGFEHFDINSFEQFCINYANEKLQQEFTQHVFKLQQEDYIKEGIEWSFIKYSDNQPCIDVIEGRGCILSLLDEQCKLPSGSDEAWAEKMFHSLTKPPYNKVFKKARFGHEKFIVSHYALDVTYEVHGFLEKNRDTVSDAQNEILKNTKNAFFKEIIIPSTLTPVYEKRKSLPSRNKKPTLGHIFKESLDGLMSTINNTNAHYIRCIKPNEMKTAWKFDNLMVLSQLRACGVLETIQISLVGFPSKYSYEEFVSRFSILLSSEDQLKLKETERKSESDTKKLSIKLLNQNIQDHTLFQLGKTKLFFRAGVLGQLEITKSNKINSVVITLQKNLRCYLGRQRWLLARQSLVLLQSSIRGALLRFKINKDLNAIVCIQSLTRGYFTRKSVKEVKKCAITIQAVVRGNIARQKFHEVVAKILEAERIRKIEARQKLEEEKRIAEERKIFEEEEKRIKELKLLEQERITTENNQIQLVIQDHKKEEEEAKIRDLALELEQQQLTAQRDLDEELAILRKEKQELQELAKRQAEELAKLELERNMYTRDGNESIRLFSKSSRPTSISEFYKSEEEDSLMVNDIWDTINTSLPPPKYSYDDLLGMRPKTALEREAKAIVNRMENTSRNIDMYQKENPEFNQVILTPKVLQTFKTDILLLRKTIKRNPYKKQLTVNNRLSVKSATELSIESKTFYDNVKPANSDVDRNYKSGYADLLEYMKGSPLTASLIANLILQSAEPPPSSNIELTDEKMKNNLGSILLPARMIVVLLFHMLENGMINQSVIFLESALGILRDDLLLLKDTDLIISFGAYLLNNVNEIRSNVSRARYNTMQDFSNDSSNAGIDRSEYLKMLLIMKRYSEAVLGKMYHFWIITIFNELRKKAPNAIMYDETSYIAKTEPEKFYKYVIKTGSFFLIQDIGHIFDKVHIAMKINCFDEVIITSVIHNLITYIDILAFNEIIEEKKALTFERSLIIKSNLMVILGWCRDHGIPDAPNGLIHVITLCQILQLKHHGLSDVDQISSTCDVITKEQVLKIIGSSDDDDLNNNTEVLSSINTKPTYLIPFSDNLFENAFLSTLCN